MTTCTPPRFQTFTLAQTADAGSPCCEVIAEECSDELLYVAAEDHMRRTATPGYRREFLAWLALAEYIAATGPTDTPYAFRIPNGGAFDTYTLTVTEDPR